MPFFDCFYVETLDDFLSSNQLTEMGFFISCTMGCSMVSFNILQSTLLVFIWLKILMYWVDNWQREDAAQLHQFILHAALDIVQDLAWTTSAMSVTCSVLSSRPFNLLPSLLILSSLKWCRYLKAVDRFNDLVVSAYVTAGHILHLFNSTISDFHVSWWFVICCCHCHLCGV